MSFNVNKKGIKPEVIRAKARRSLVEKAIFNNKRSSQFKEILVESIVGKKFPGYIKGSEYQVISVGDPIENTVVKIVKYPRYPAAAGKTFKLGSTISRWGRSHPLVQGIVSAVERDVTASTTINKTPKASTMAKADDVNTGIVAVSLEDELRPENIPVDMPPPSVPPGIFASPLKGVGPAAETIINPEGDAIIPDALPASPVKDLEPENLDFLSTAPKVIRYDRSVYNALEGLEIKIPSGPYDELDRIAKKEAGEIRAGDETRPQVVYAIKSILDQIPTEIATSIVAPSDPSTKGFDPVTKSSIESFQRYVKIEVDGVVGPITARSLLGKNNWEPKQDMSNIRADILDIANQLSDEPLKVIKVPSYKSVSQGQLIAKLRAAGLKNGNILAGIMGNIASESAQKYNAVGDDAARAVIKGKIKVNTDTGKMTQGAKDFLMKAIPVTAPKRPPSLYRSFGLIQWNVSGGEGEGFLSRRLSGNPTRLNKFETLTNLDNQVLEIVYLARREFGDLIEKNVSKDIGEVEDYAYKWGNQVEKFEGHYDRSGKGKKSYDHRISSALKIANEKEDAVFGSGASSETI